MNINSRIYIAGINGMVGSACYRMLYSKGYKNLKGNSSKELDLRDQNKVFKTLKDFKPDIIINAAALVGGIYPNSKYPYDFLMDNMLIQNNLIRSSHELNIPKFIFLGSSCIYPRMSKQPIKEEYLLSGSLEETNQWYALAKISGIKLIEALNRQHNRNYVSLMPTNLYGPGDNYDLENSHVIPALIAKFHYAKETQLKDVTLWGTGNAKREFLFVEDLAEAIVFTLENKVSGSIYNIGSGHEIRIFELANLIKTVIGYNGKINWDKTKPDGTPRKLLDSSSFLKFGWRPKKNLIDGIKFTYQEYLSKEQHS